MNQEDVYGEEAHGSRGEVRVIDPNTGGAKGSKPEDYAQVPPVPLMKTLDKLRVMKSGAPFPITPRAGFAYFLDQRDPAGLITAAAASVLEMGKLYSASPNLSYGLDAVSRVYRFGGTKYARGNWCRGYRHSLAVAAAWRHIVQHEGGEPYNFEKWNGEICSEPHLAHFVFHAFALYEFYRLKLGTDDLLFFVDRYGREAEGAA